MHNRREAEKATIKKERPLQADAPQPCGKPSALSATKSDDDSDCVDDVALRPAAISGVAGMRSGEIVESFYETEVIFRFRQLTEVRVVPTHL